MNKYLTEDGASEIQSKPLYQSLTNLNPFDDKDKVAPRQRKNSDVGDYKMILPDAPSERQINTHATSEDNARRELNDVAIGEKIQGMYREYNHLLTSQLDSQRHYFEGKLAQQRQELLAKPDLIELDQSIMDLQQMKEQRLEIV